MIYIVFFIILLLVELAYFRLADRLNIIDKPNERSSHSRLTLRGGGIVFYLGALLYWLWFGLAYPWFLAGLLLITIVSMVDDIRSVPNRIRLFFHFTAMLLLFTEWGLFVGLPWWYAVVALVLCTGIINAYNFMDGINGITGGYSLVLLLTLAYINLELVPFIDQAFLYTVVLSVLVFNFFNFRKKARCFAGDVGSVSIAFIILFALGCLMLKTGDLSYIVLLAVYGVDSVLTIIHRMILRENIFKAHRKHAYQIMSNELNVPHLYVAAMYMSIQLLVNIGFLIVASSLYWYYLGGVLILLGIIYILFMKKFFIFHLQQVVSN